MVKWQPCGCHESHIAEGCSGLVKLQMTGFDCSRAVRVRYARDSFGAVYVSAVETEFPVMCVLHGNQEMDCRIGLKFKSTNLGGGRYAYLHVVYGKDRLYVAVTVTVGMIAWWCSSCIRSNFDLLQADSIRALLRVAPAVNGAADAELKAHYGNIKV